MRLILVEPVLGDEEEEEPEEDTSANTGPMTVTGCLLSANLNTSRHGTGKLEVPKESWGAA